MTVPLPNSLDNVLRHIATATPEPWYPSAFARQSGVPRDSLDQPLERLRLAGLVRLTDWMPNLGQGYVLTPDGTRVVNSPNEMTQLGNAFVPAPREIAVPTDRPPERGASDWERGEAVRDSLLQPMEPRVTRFMLAANILVFAAGLGLAVSNNVPAQVYLAGTASPREPLLRLHLSQVFLSEGALLGINVVQGQWWRLLTCCFVHFGFLHIAANMYSLIVVGPLTERMWGRWRYLLIYLISGFCGSCAMLANSPITPGAGASGAIWGLFAAFAVWVLLNKRYLPPQLFAAWKRSLFLVFLLNVGITYAPDMFDMGFKISAAAHFGGGIAGALAAVLVHFQRYGSLPVRAVSLPGLVLVPVAFLGFLLWTMDTRPDWVDRRLEWGGFPRVRAALEHSLKMYDDDVKPALGKPPRDPEKVEKARAAIRAQQTELANVRKFLDGFGTIPEPAIEKRRQLFLEATAVGDELCDLSDKALEDGKDWKEREEALERVAVQVRQLLGK